VIAAGASGRSVAVCFMLPLLWLVSASPAALQPDQIALLINDKSPGSRELAEFYAKARGIPAGRIIALSIDQPPGPFPLEEMPRSDYEPLVAEPIRKFLLTNGLASRVKCLVSFWGLPLRVGPRTNSDAENAELSAIDQERVDLVPRVARAVDSLEALARQLQPQFTPTRAPLRSDEVVSLARRADGAMAAIVKALQAMPNNAARADSVQRLLDLVGQLGGPLVRSERLVSPDMALLTTQPATSDEIADVRQKLTDMRNRVMQMSVQTPVGRAGQRDLTRSNLGTLSLLRILDMQHSELQTAETQAALDSELALLWWGQYSKFRWQRNPFYVHYAGPPVPGLTLMVMRLDGPTIPIVRSIITTSIDVEKTGLQGQVAIDARGKLPSDGYGVYDQTLRNLAGLLRSHTKLKVTLDDQEAIFPAHSLDHVAIYCGWYSLRRYVPECQFNAGAVGFHIASFELVGLHSPDETGWVHGLLSDGVVATLGPVAEPYVQSFPAADEFFPLLLTGKLSLAEVYWKTTPMASWMQDCIGDPLYRPYAVNPALAVSDLPPVLRQAIGSGHP
jgi:uncharacterized protein (TIGR03790 family)